MAIVRLGNDVCGAGCASAGAIIVIGRFSEVTGRGKRLRPARRWKSWMPTFGPSGAKPKPLSRGTEGSNPALSSGESVSQRELAWRGREAGLFARMCGPCQATEPAETGMAGRHRTTGDECLCWAKFQYRGAG